MITQQVATPPPVEAPSRQGGPLPLLLLALLLWAVLAATALVLRPPLPPDETRYLTVAWEMWARGDVLVPHINGAPYHHKPPLLFWLIDLSWLVAGVDSTAGRTVPLLFTLASALLSAWIARLLWPQSRRLAGAAALGLIGTAAFALLGSLLMFDTLMATCVLLGVAAMIKAWRSGRRGWWAVYGLAIGLGVLAKGPVVLAHLLPPALLAPLWAEGVASWRRWYLGLAGGVGLGAVLALSWALPAAYSGGEEYARMILWGQTAGRMVKSFAHVRPWYYYLLMLPVLLYPWLWWPRGWRGLRAAGAPRRWDAGMRFCAVWLGAGLLVFTLFSAKQPHYLLPLLPSAVLLAVRLAEGMPAAEDRRLRLIPALPLVVVGAVLALAPPLAWAAEAIGQAGRLPDWIAHTTPLPGVLLVALVALWWRGGRPAGAAWLSAGTAAAFVAIHLAAADELMVRYDLRPVAELVAEQADTEIALIRIEIDELGFALRLTRPVEEIAPEDFAAWRSDHPRGTVIASGHRPSLAPLAAQVAPAFTMPYRGGLLMVWPGGPESGG